ncbi:MAG: sensor histidine kinase [Candidatus Cyclobacteriaceae bacterium M2_1C_046]
MKDIIYKPENIKKVEFWVATAIFVFAVFLLLTPSVGTENMWAPNRIFFEKANITFGFSANYFVPKLFQYITLYLTFLVLNFKVAPDLVEKKSVTKNIFILILTFIVLGLVLGTINTYLKTYLYIQYETADEAYRMFFQKSFIYSLWLIFILGFYNVIKYFGVYLLTHSEKIQAKYKYISPGVIIAFIVWMVSIFILMIAEAHKSIIIAWALFSLSGIFLFLFSFNSLIPRSFKTKKPFKNFLIKIFLILVISIFPMAFLAMIAIHDEEAAFGFSFFNAAFHLFITTPLVWIAFKRHLKGNEEIYNLKKELGKTSASFDFLRSQINPHFLFNALNTIYGTAIQEKAERTGEGIEKLGDMMRFMLQENMQEKIPLAREVEYLNNYIGLQQLRTDANPNVRINTQIEEPVDNYQISPMLLIPFVENAFKHGISFREPSHINITLEIRDNTLYFDVYNSKHNKQEQDPEKYKSGIGLNNVKQRLQLLYNDQHELILRETGKEYFIHLTIKLS